MDASTDRLSRRQIIAGLTCTVAVTACSGPGAPGSSTASLSVVQIPSGSALSTTVTPAGMTAEVAAWQNLTGSQFNAGSYTLRLTGIDAQALDNNRPTQLRRQPFTARFDITQGGAMPGDRIYTLSSATPFNIYLSNSATGSTGMYAVFN